MSPIDVERAAQELAPEHLEDLRRSGEGRAAVSASLLLRHRWCGDPRLQLWRCTPGAVSLYDSPDPCCPGCERELRMADVPRVERYDGISRDRILAEDLGLRLDLRVLEMYLEEREALRRAG